MESNGWSIVFEGQIADGRSLEEVKRNLAALFKADTGKVERLFAKPRIVLRKNLNHPSAVKYKKVLAHAGALCRIEKAEKHEKANLGTDNESKLVQAGGTKGSMVCPVCSHEQEIAEECIRCGTIIRKYLEKMNREPDDFSSVGSTAGPEPTKADPHKLMVFWALPLVVVLIIVIFKWQANRPISHEPGHVAPNQPVQINIKGERRFLHKSYRVTPLATFEIEARVLSSKRYYFDRGAELSPVDLALGWGPMSDSRVLKDINIKQSNRFYYWRTGQFPPCPQALIEQSSANMHIIPANKEIAKRLKKIRKGNVVTIKGYLVRVDGENFQWQSSLTRKDTGAGACEVVFAEKLDVI